MIIYKDSGRLLNILEKGLRNYFIKGIVDIF